MKRAMVVSTLIISILPALACLSGCSAFFPTVCWDGVYHRELRVEVVSAESGTPVENATVTWLSAGYEEWRAREAETLKSATEEERAEILDAHMQTAVTDSGGECKLAPLFGCSGSTRRRFLLWRSRTNHFGISGTLEVRAEGFQPRRASLFDLVDAEKVTGDKAPVEVHVELTRDAADE